MQTPPSLSSTVQESHTQRNRQVRDTSECATYMRDVSSCMYFIRVRQVVAITQPGSPHSTSVCHLDVMNVVQEATILRQQQHAPVQDIFASALIEV